MNAAQTVFAHAHVLLVHGPIALVLAVLAVELWFRARGKPSPVDVVRVLLVIAAASAVLTVATGLVYADIEDFHGKTARTLEQHRNLGIGAAIWAVATLSLHGAAQRVPKLRIGYAIALVLAAVGVSAAGHLGGEVVHGEGYLWKSAYEGGSSDDAPIVASDGDENGATNVARDRWPDDPSILARGDRVDFVRDVQPILERSCLKCHGAEKRKGKLRLDKKKYAMHGGETGEVIVPGNPDESLFIKLIALPPDDEDVMPEKGKLLSKSEIELLKKWIREGAHWPDEAAP